MDQTSLLLRRVAWEIFSLAALHQQLPLLVCWTPIKYRPLTTTPPANSENSNTPSSPRLAHPSTQPQRCTSPAKDTSKKLTIKSHFLSFYVFIIFAVARTWICGAQAQLCIPCSWENRPSTKYRKLNPLVIILPSLILKQSLSHASSVV